MSLFCSKLPSGFLVYTEKEPKSSKWPTRPYLIDPSPLFPMWSHSLLFFPLTQFQPHCIPCMDYIGDHVCTSAFSAWNAPPPDIHMAYSVTTTSFRSLFNCLLFNEAYPDYRISNYIYSYIVLSFAFLHSICHLLKYCMTFIMFFCIISSRM